MSNILFQTDQLHQFCLDCMETIKSYYREFAKSNFEAAKQLAEELTVYITDYEKSSTNNHPDEFYNDCFIFKKFASLLNSYAEYWSKVCVGLYSESWDTLQDVLDLLRLIKKFSRFDATSLFKFLERQAQSLELLYPYSLFCSIEAVVGRADCSICGKNIESMECIHIAGELYRGKLAYGIVKEFKKLLSVSLVENPEDKRCKITSRNFSGVEYLSELVSIKKCNPLLISHTKESLRRIKIAGNTSIGRNTACPCGSGKKFKKCCINKEFAEKRHIEIITLADSGVSLNDFIYLSRHSA